MNKLLMMPLLVGSHYGYNPEYENLSDEEKANMDYVDECLNDPDENFCNACTRTMFLVLEITSKINTEEEPTREYVSLKKEEIKAGFSQDDQDRIELFMYACIQTMGIYSDERIQERREERERSKSKIDDIKQGE